jgi:hypothetical protein
MTYWPDLQFGFHLTAHGGINRPAFLCLLAGVCMSSAFPEATALLSGIQDHYTPHVLATSARHIRRQMARYH